MSNVYETPKSELGSNEDPDNNSGMNQDTFPPGVKGWCWGGFLLNWIWAIGNKTWIGLLTLLPYIGFVFAIYLGVKGRELAWKNNRWESVEHFNRVQKKWTMWSLIISSAGIIAAVFVMLITS